MSPHDLAIQLAANAPTRNLNEADTRHQLIDELLHEVLSWPRPLVRCECFTASGYLDYALIRNDQSVVLVIEAKKEGTYFNLPAQQQDSSTARHLSVKTLLTDEAIRKAMNQIRGYCIDIGCQFAAVTNGHEWIFFRTFEKGKDWRGLRAFVVPNLRYFSEHFTEAINNLGYTSIVERAALHRLLSTHPAFNRELYYPKQRITAYNAQITANQYAPVLRPIMDRYFGVIDENDQDLMEACYVSGKEFENAFTSARAVLADSLTPYLEQYRIQDIANRNTGGTFARRIEKTLLSRPSTSVMVLFGGKGIGKSTFLRRLLFHKQPQILKKHSVIALVDLLAVPETKDIIHERLWEEVVKGLDQNRLLSGNRVELLNLFSVRYEMSKKQQLFGLHETSEAYNIKLNELVQQWLLDKKYCAAELAKYWTARHRGLIVVLDNTDQFSRDLQDFCFQIAHEIAKALNCLVIISMREERFYTSTIHGTLDAFQNSGFHLSSPLPNHVFLKRIQYVNRLLNNKHTREDILGVHSLPDTVTRLSQVFLTFANEFRKSDSHLSDFLTACSHGNIRLALEIFRNFVSSRYTNINEMTSIRGLWTLQIHQVLKPIMIPNRFFYEESQSHVPNIFQVRSKNNGSHFTALRILNFLANGADPNNPPYIPVPSLATDFVETFNMREDFDLNMDMLLKYRLIEANNRIDTYSADVDSVRLTTYGFYFVNELSRFFTYIDLIAADTAVFDEQLANSITALSNNEYALWEASLHNPKKRAERVKKRLDKADAFIRHLEDEEKREFEYYGISDSPSIAQRIRDSFNVERKEVQRSAGRQRY